jgi:hypothetical protein
MGANASNCGKCGALVSTPTADAYRKNSLIRDLTRFRELLLEVTELNTMIRPQSDFPVSDSIVFKKKSFMRYFWPFLVGGVAGGSILYMVVTLITFYSTMQQANNIVSRSDASRLSSNMMSDIYIGYFVCVLVALGIIIIGIKISKSKQAAFNKNADMMIREQTENYQKGLKNQKMIDIKNDDLREIRKYEPLVPEEYQDPDSIAKIIELIRSIILAMLFSLNVKFDLYMIVMHVQLLSKMVLQSPS